MVSGQLRTDRLVWGGGEICSSAGDAMQGFSSPQDVARTARLILAKELCDGTITESDLVARRDVLGALGPRPVPGAHVKIFQRLAMKAGLLDFENGFLSPVRRARRMLLGPMADAPPRFLVRVDEFPDSRAFDDGLDLWRTATKAFHETLAAAGVPYLMAIVPQYTHLPLDPTASGGRPLDDHDHALIEQMRADGVTFAQHGATHRTRFRDPRRRSELSGLDSRQTDELINDGRERLAQVGVFPRVFVPPFNRFNASQFPDLARHFHVVGGGPENVPLLGFQGGPVWWGDAVFLPSYAPLYAGAGHLPAVIDRLVGLAVGTWVPIVLHISWEIGDRFRSLASFAEKIAPYAASWEDFSRAIDAARKPDGAPSAARSGPR